VSKPKAAPASAIHVAELTADDDLDAVFALSRALFLRTASKAPPMVGNPRVSWTDHAVECTEAALAFHRVERAWQQSRAPGSDDEKK
jgi:hypothetical protein